MRRILFPLLLLCTISAVDARVLAVFNQNNYEGWVYDRPGFYMDTEAISKNKIGLYGSCTLTSPQLNCAGVDTVIVVVNESYSLYYQNDKYDARKGSPTVSLIDEGGNVVKSVEHVFSTAQLQRVFTVKIDISDVSATILKLRLSCPQADTYCALYMRDFVVEGAESTPPVAGDVNGDGELTSADVTSLYNWLLNGDHSAIVNGDVNGDGSITSNDVTAVYNFMLN